MIYAAAVEAVISKLNIGISFQIFLKNIYGKKSLNLYIYFFFVKILTKLILASKILGTLSAPVLDPANLLYVRFLYFASIVLDFVCTVPV